MIPQLIREPNHLIAYFRFFIGASPSTRCLLMAWDMCLMMVTHSSAEIQQYFAKHSMCMSKFVPVIEILPSVPLRLASLLLTGDCHVVSLQSEIFTLNFLDLVQWAVRIVVRLTTHQPHSSFVGVTTIDSARSTLRLTVSGKRDIVQSLSTVELQEGTPTRSSFSTTQSLMPSRMISIAPRPYC